MTEDSMGASSDAPSPAGLSARSSSIAIDGVFSGVIGGLTVALFYLLIDTIAGRPLWTPSLLGSALFLGSGVDKISEVNVPMVFAYTGVHMAMFVGAGMVFSFMVAQFESNPPLAILLILLFVCFEAAFFAFTMALAPGVIGALGASSVAAANLLAAVAMSAYFWRTHPGAGRGLSKIWDD
jgi:hypothetical protein